MSERDQRRDGNRDTSGDWIRSYGPKGEYPDWHYGRTDTSHKVKPATKRHAFGTDFEDTVLETATELVELLIKKHKDYGPLNIANAPGGPLNGLRVRLHDKLSRLNHLLDKGVAPENESLEDTFKDIANYAIICLLVSRKQWPTK